MDMHSDKLRQQFEGQLYKYTNVMKGWQHRWFVLDPEMGTLSYFLSDADHKPRGVRGSIHLAAAVISPSDEDSNTFTVNSTTGEFYKLRAGDARARQDWVNRLRAVAEMHTIAIAQSNPPLPPREHHTLSTSAANPNPLVHCTMALLDAFSMVRDHLQKAEHCNNLLARAVEDLPVSGPGMLSSDADLLVLKATTSATLQCLGHCLSILQQQQLAPPSTPALPPVSAVPGSSQSLSSAGKPPLTKKNSLPTNTPASPSHFEGKKSGSQRSHHHHQPVVTQATPMQGEASRRNDPTQSTVPVEFAKVEASYISPSDRQDMKLKEKEKEDSAKTKGKVQESDPLGDEEVTDEEDVRAGGAGGRTFQAEENKSVILHLLSQLKLGMDLTKVVLPTFILERRSLLEMFADCLGHPNFFIKIMESSTAEERMMAVVEWYLTSLHIGRDCSIAKKPYNPIIGETFHCSWKVQTPDNRTDYVHYTAEQVSHHPPVTAFYAECPSRNMCLNASIWTKSNFSGMSVGVTMVGDVSLHLGDFRERYDFTLPSAYARSIISVPWIELGGKVVINCPSTGYSAHIIFHTKPFYGGKVHQVTGEVRNEAGVNTCKIQGEWNSSYDFTFPGGRTNVIDVTRLPVIRKRVKPVGKQGVMESRRLWNEVTNALAEGDISRATEHKRNLEEQQRSGEKHRAITGTSFPTRYFHRTDDDTWMYNNMLVSV
ncbi:oxysterol-binding protein-related protein 11-like [Thrips palmi]|uniref:Oxysterol-binding protein n=1 Tax=Thrips palmi TaxID=161013 RepID=A0A6P8YRF5_THRPL|nr:oxysterol-binding protein-related protein 11-like [Thrips palmi]XP_034239581.1 oxysterol-binding protein-related protein 11-like [Thrips palmi]